jgi:hypothetical protein
MSEVAETIQLERFSRFLGYEVLEAEPVGPKLVKVVVWLDGRIVQALVADPDSRMGWAFLTNNAATFRASEGQS